MTGRRTTALTARSDIRLSLNFPFGRNAKGSQRSQSCEPITCLEGGASLQNVEGLVYLDRKDVTIRLNVSRPTIGNPDSINRVCIDARRTSAQAIEASIEQPDDS